MSNNGIRPWQYEAFKRLMEMDAKDPTLRAERQELKDNTLLERYSGRSAFLFARRGGKSMLQNEIYRQMIEQFQGLTNNLVVDSIPRTLTSNKIEGYWLDDCCSPMQPDNRDQHSWKQDKFIPGPATPPSDAKRAKLRAKRKKRK